MGSPNPYAPPGGNPSEPAIPPLDSADLFVQTLAPPLLKVAVGVLIVMGLTMLLLFVRMALVVAPNATGIGIAAAHAVLGLVAFAVAWGIREGRMWVAIAGFILSPAVGAASLFALVTGSIAGLLGGALALANLGLLATSLSAVEKIGRAKDALRQLHAREG